MFGSKDKSEQDTPSASAAGLPADPSAKKARRPILIRLFALKFWGAVRLTVICVVVGIVMKIGNITSSPTEFDALNAISEIWKNTFAGLVWIVRNGWVPALLGATVVLPVWVLWRLVSLPFRR